MRHIGKKLANNDHYEHPYLIPKEERESLRTDVREKGIRKLGKLSKTTRYYFNPPPIFFFFFP
jgi:hypothetical protein